MGLFVNGKCGNSDFGYYDATNYLIGRTKIYFCDSNRGDVGE